MYHDDKLLHRGNKPGTTPSINLTELSFCCCSVTQSFSTVCDPMNCSIPGFPVLHYLPKFAQTHVRLFETPWIAAHQASLYITNSQSSLRLTSIESVMPSSHLILCRPLLLLPPIPSSIRVFSNEWTLRMRWPKYWLFYRVWKLF